MLFAGLSLCTSLVLFNVQDAHAGEKKGDSYITYVLLPDGQWQKMSHNYCDPCGVIGSLLACNCVPSKGNHGTQDSL